MISQTEMDFRRLLVNRSLLREVMYGGQCPTAVLSVLYSVLSGIFRTLMNSMHTTTWRMHHSLSDWDRKRVIRSAISALSVGTDPGRDNCSTARNARAGYYESSPHRS